MLDNIDKKRLYKKYLQRLKKCNTGDAESDHDHADKIVVEIIAELGLDAIVREFNNIEKFYA